jgi:molecular chaperone GrpE (heat shock protein)
VQAVNYAWFSAGYALEMDEKQKVQERDAAALREQLEEAKAELAAAMQASEATLEKARAELEKARAELEKARAELESARRDAEAEVESAKTAAVQQFLGSEEYTRRVAEQALAAYERGAEDMKLVALQLNPRLDAAKLVLPLD